MAATEVQSFIPLCVPYLQGREWEYIKDCLDSGWVSSVGSYVSRFESQFASRNRAEFGVATSSGTTALHLALIVKGVRPDDEVLIPSVTFIAPINAIRYVGAWPLFMDSESDYLQMDSTKLERFLVEQTERTPEGLVNKNTKRRITALMPVHILGHPGRIDEFRRLAQQFGLAIIDDVTESLGALFQGEPIGKTADIACYSFNGNKLMTTGGGGMMTFHDQELAKRAKHLSTQAKTSTYEFIHDEVGFNYRLVNILAAMGCAQLEQLDEFLAKKRSIANRYAVAFEGHPIIRPMLEAPWARSAFWLYTVTLHSEPPEGLLNVVLSMNDRQIQTRPLWEPGHMSKAHKYDFSPPCPVAEQLYRSCLSLPCSVGMTESEQERVIEALLAETSEWK